MRHMIRCGECGNYSIWVPDTNRIEGFARATSDFTDLYELISPEVRRAVVRLWNLTQLKVSFKEGYDLTDFMAYHSRCNKMQIIDEHGEVHRETFLTEVSNG